MQLYHTRFLLLLGLVVNHGATELYNMDVVMRSGDVIQEMDEGQFPHYRNGECTVRFPRDGNFATQNGFFTGGFDANQNSQCASAGSEIMTYILQVDGNFVAYCGTYLDYATNTYQGHGDYFLAIDDNCILHLYKGTFDCNSVSIEGEIWTNIRTQPLKNGERLGKGEIVRLEDGTNLVMQSSDGNLVLYKGTEDVLWAANEEWDAPPNSNLHEFYAKVTNGRDLILVGKDYQDGEETVYFRKNLKQSFVGGAACFTLTYDADQDDFFAVLCDGDEL